MKDGAAAARNAMVLAQSKAMTRLTDTILNAKPASRRILAEGYLNAALEYAEGLDWFNDLPSEEKD